MVYGVYGVYGVYSVQSNLQMGSLRNSQWQGFIRCHNSINIIHKYSEVLSIYVSLVKVFQIVSGLLVTFVCETVKLPYRFRQIHAALFVILNKSFEF